METWGFSCGSDSKESACNAEDLGSISGLALYLPPHLTPLGCAFNAIDLLLTTACDVLHKF